MSSPDPFLLRVMQTISDQHFLPDSETDRKTPGGVAKQHILVALSGGADSTALLVALWRLRNRLKLRLSALYVNHGMRLAAQLRREELHCQRLCAKINVSFQIERADIPKIASRDKISLETAGRHVRYHLLHLHASRINADLIATGHHRDDQIETVLFRLLRGGWIDSLAGIPYRRSNIIRPLLDCTKNEIIAFLRREKTRFSTDSTNKDISFSRNRIRAEILPALRKENPSIDQSLLDYSHQARTIWLRIDREVQKFLRRHSFMTPGGKLLVDRQQFTRLSPVMSSYVVREGIQRVTPHFSAISPEQAISVLNVALAKAASVNLSDGITARRATWSGFKVEDLVILAPKKTVVQEVVVENQSQSKQAVSLFSDRARLSISVSRSMKIPDDHYRVKIDFSKVSPPLVIRGWTPGDRFAMMGMKGNKKVGDILTDRKYPALLRDEQLLVADAQGILWLVGHAIADRVKITKSTTRTLQLSFEIRKDCL